GSPARLLTTSWPPRQAYGCWTPPARRTLASLDRLVKPRQPPSLLSPSKGGSSERARNGRQTVRSASRNAGSAGAQVPEHWSQSWLCDCPAHPPALGRSPAD